MNKKTIIDEALSEIHDKKYMAEMIADKNYRDALKNSKQFYHYFLSYVHLAVNPPSTNKLIPVTQRDASDNR